MLVVGNGTVISRDNSNPFFDNGAVVVDGGLIVEVGDSASLKSKYKDARFIDAGGGLIMPGLINAHNHIYSAFARGLSIKGYNAKTFPEILDGLWWKLDRNLLLEDTYLSAMVTYIECIKNGCTTVHDHHASYGEIRGSLFKIAEAAKKLGVRSNLCFEVSDRNGLDKAKEAIEENAEFIKHTKTENSNMLKSMMGLHASFTLSDETLALCRENTPADTGFHIHAAEGTVDEEDCLKKYGKRVINRLNDLGILGRNTITGHCIHINEEEMNLIKESETIVVHNPQSNMGNAVGIPPCMEMMRRGIAVGLGTDGYTNDMLESLKVTNIIHKHILSDPTAAWEEAPKMLFENNAEVNLRIFNTETGVLKTGAAADIIISDYVPHTPLNGTNFSSHILFGMSGKSITHTIINGVPVMENRKFISIDEERIYAQSIENARKLWKRINS